MADKYGVNETNGFTELGINGSDYHSQDRESVPWNTPGLYVTRLRLLSDPSYGMWDVSYCHGQLNGKEVRVDLPFSQLSKGQIITEIIRYAKKDGVYAKSLGILENISKLS